MKALLKYFLSSKPKPTFLNVDLLALCLTQRCNALCKHCQCGDAKDYDMSIEIMRKVFDEVKFVRDFVLKGGELMLAPEKLEELYSVLVEKNVKVEYFSIATNAIFNDDNEIHDVERYLEALGKLRDYSKVKDHRPMFVSFDKFHRSEGERILGAERYQENVARLSSHPLFCDFQLEADVFLMHEGRAKNLSCNDTLIIDSGEVLGQDLYIPYGCRNDCNFSRVTRLLVGAHGNITRDKEYELQQRDSLGRVSAGEKINDILLRSPSVIKCRNFDEWNEHTSQHNTKMGLMKIAASAWKLGIPQDRIWEVFK